MVMVVLRLGFLIVAVLLMMSWLIAVTTCSAALDVVFPLQHPTFALGSAPTLEYGWFDPTLWMSFRQVGWGSPGVIAPL